MNNETRVLQGVRVELFIPTKVSNDCQSGPSIRQVLRLMPGADLKAVLPWIVGATVQDKLDESHGYTGVVRIEKATLVDLTHEEPEEKSRITQAHLLSAFGSDKEVKSGDLVKRLMRVSREAESTCWRAIGDDGYLRPFLQRTAPGRLSLVPELAKFAKGVRALASAKTVTTKGAK